MKLRAASSELHLHSFSIMIQLKKHCGGDERKVKLKAMWKFHIRGDHLEKITDFDPLCDVGRRVEFKWKWRKLCKHHADGIGGEKLRKSIVIWLENDSQIVATNIRRMWFRGILNFFDTAEKWVMKLITGAGSRWLRSPEKYANLN